MSSVAQQAPFSLLFYSDWRFQKKYIKKKQKIHFCKVFRENEIISYPKYIRERKEEKKNHVLFDDVVLYVARYS